MNDLATFQRLEISGWRQFEKVDLELDPKLTIITGANGAGKSSILGIFSRHFGYKRPFLSIPVTDQSGSISYLNGIVEYFRKRLGGESQSEVGSITYTNGIKCSLNVPAKTGISYDVALSHQQSVHGTHIDSHQPISTFNVVGQIPMRPITVEQAYENYNSEVASRYQGTSTGNSPMYRLKESLLSMALLGAGNKYYPGNSSVLAVYTEFVDRLREMLPPTLGFVDFDIRPPEIVLVTKTGEFLIDAASGGIAALIDITWRLHILSKNRQRFVVTIDEPENHLHPSMQRSLMGRLTTAFPTVQFIVATHSPFIVSSVRESRVYVLRYRREGGSVIDDFVLGGGEARVVSEYLPMTNKAGSANDILREVLGVPATMPEWAEESLANIVREFRGLPINDSTLLNLRQQLSQIGFDDYYSDALMSIVKGKK